MCTLVRLVSGVGPNVLLQVGQLAELSVADLASVGPDPQLAQGQLGQVLLVSVGGGGGAGFAATWVEGHLVW